MRAPSNCPVRGCLEDHHLHFPHQLQVQGFWKHLSINNLLERHAELTGTCYPPLAFVQGKERRLKSAKEGGERGRQTPRLQGASRCPQESYPPGSKRGCTHRALPASKSQSLRVQAFLGLRHADGVEGQSWRQETQSRDSKASSSVSQSPPKVVLLLSVWSKARRQRKTLLSGLQFQGLSDYLPETEGRVQISLRAILYLQYPLNWTARKSNQSTLKEISPEYSLKGLMLKLKLQYFGHLMWRADSLERTLMLGKIEGKRRRGWQRIRWLDGITDSMHVSLRKL